MPESVSVSDIAGPSADAVGLLPTSVTGFPSELWGHSRSAILARQFQIDQSLLYPAMQGLLYRLLLAELDPPFDSTPEASLFQVRLDTLLSLGALDQVSAMLDQSGQARPEFFRRGFDVALLMYSEDAACETLRSTPSLSPTFPARVFCLARGGDWDAAALSLETGRALGYLTDQEDQLVARFLDPTLYEDEPLPVFPDRPSPLVFRMLEAIGEPVATAHLPAAFAYSDLNNNSGWKAQIEAAERLVHNGAMDPNLLFGFYSERRPAASGGVWDRVSAVQLLDAALTAGDVKQVSRTLPSTWDAMAQAELEVPFAKLFSHRLPLDDLSGAGRTVGFEIGMLSDRYEEVAHSFTADSDREKILIALANGKSGEIFAADPTVAAIQDGFRADGIPVRLQSLTGNNRLGEAILRAITMFDSGAHGNLDELTDAIAFFRAIGLEDVARRAALQVVLLERRG